MKRGIIYNNGYSIIIPNDEIWMTSWEIADLFYVTPVSINHAIKRILKKEVLIEFQIHRYICLENGNHADVYNMEMVIALSLQMYITWRWSLPCLSILTRVIPSCSVNG